MLAIIVDIKRNFSTTIFHIKRRYADDVISFTLLNQILESCQITSLRMHKQQVEGNLAELHRDTRSPNFFYFTLYNLAVQIFLL